jgi:Prolyl oligopeptidase family
MKKIFWIVMGLLLSVGILQMELAKRKEKAIAAACAPLPERGIYARNLAMEEGYAVNKEFQCIDLASYQRVQQERAEWEKNRPARELAELERKRVATAEYAKGSPPNTNKENLRQARQNFLTHVALNDKVRKQLPNPPADLFWRIDYKSSGQTLAAFISPNPKDNKKHPAIIWLTGGDTNTLEDFWTPGPANNDQSASAFYQKDIVMMFPTLRGGNTNAGAKEFFYGEVDDVLAAAEQLARLPYVDASQIYLGGHSTGGTLALLVAESSSHFKAVFSMGAVANAESYAPTWISELMQRDLEKLVRNFDPNANPPAQPQSVMNHWRQELKLRAPVEWLHGIQSPVYIFEGDSGSSNINDFRELCTTHWMNVHCVRMVGHNHFSYLQQVSKLLANSIIATPTQQPYAIDLKAFEQNQ